MMTTRHGQGMWWPFVLGLLTLLQVARAQEPLEHRGLYEIKDGSAQACLASAKGLPKSGNTIVDTRCALVAFEVCMNKRSGVISQSQDAPRQCTMMKTLAGPDACAQPCAEALRLPVGGSGVVGRYTGLTAGAVRCYENEMKGVGGQDPARDACTVGSALSCLMNGSSSPAVNAAIRRERQTACRSFAKQYPKEYCSACKGAEVGLDYETMKEADPLPVLPGAGK